MLRYVHSVENVPVSWPRMGSWAMIRTNIGCYKAGMWDEEVIKVKMDKGCVRNRAKNIITSLGHR